MENTNQQSLSADQKLSQLTPQSVVPQSTPNKSRLPLSFIIVLFIALVPIGVYILGAKNTNQQKQASIAPTNVQNSPTPIIDETVSPAPNGVGANWKTYTNEKYGFSFKYPNYDWEAMEMPSPPGFNEGVSVSLNCISCKSTNTLSSFIINPSNFKSIDEYLNANLKKSEKATITDYRKVKIDGIDAIKAINLGTCIDRTYQCDPSTIEYFLIINGRGFLIDEYYKDIFNYTKLSQFPKPDPDILSTFRFAN